MKKAALVLVLVPLTVFLLASIVEALADDEVPAEFYFTRLVYTENGNRRGGGFGRNYGFQELTMPKPIDPFVCPEFGGRTFFPRQGWGWAIDYPGADCKFMGGIHRLTGMNVSPNPNVIEIMDDDLFKFPYVYDLRDDALKESATS